nr:reverse transcriptase domain-containing protein [Tanacetum cinerariifolium]
MNTTSKENSSKSDDRNDKLADQISTLVDIFAKKVVTPASVKAVEESCVTCGGAHACYNCPNTDINQPSVCVATGTYNQVAPQNRASNYMAPPGFAPVQNSQNSGFFQNQTSTSGTLSSNTIPNLKGEMKAITTRSGVAYEGPSIPTNPSPKKVVERGTEETTDKEQTNFQGTMLLKKLPEKLGDPSKFLIPCDFPGIDVCHALVDLGASINLTPLFIWKKLSLPELTPTRMTLELADRSITLPKGVAKDVFIKVGKFYFPTDFVVVDFEADPRVPLLLGRSFLRTDRALIDVYGEEITLWVNDEAATFNLNQTTRYSSTYDDLSVNRFDIIDVAREEYAQEILEEIKAYLKDESISPEINHADCDPEGDICLIEKLLNNDPFQLPLIDLKQGEVVKSKSSIEEPPELELKDLPSHLEYAYLEGVDKLPAIIAKDLKDDEKETLLKVLKSHKRAIAWKITDIKGIDPHFCTHKILMEEDYNPLCKVKDGLTRKFMRKRPLSPVPMEHLLIVECLLAFAMLLGHFKEGSYKRTGQEVEKESAKKQKLAEQEQDKVADDDTPELKRCLDIVPEDDDDVAIEATPLSFKSPTIVDYKIYKEGKKSYFKIIRADGNSQNYLTFGIMFKNFNREDLEVLRSIIKERFNKTKPVDDMKNLLFQTLKTMFEPHVEDII